MTVWTVDCRLCFVLWQVIEAYRKVQSSKGKKKSPSKKEKESFYKALKERDAIAKELLHHETQ